MSAIERAITAAGGLTKLAASLKIKPQVIFNWRARGVPAERVLDLERATGISRHQFRPDLYPSKEKAA